jgi:hypothetical protein
MYLRDCICKRGTHVRRRAVAAWMVENSMFLAIPAFTLLYIFIPVYNSSM